MRYFLAVLLISTLATVALAMHAPAMLPCESPAMSGPRVEGLLDSVAGLWGEVKWIINALITLAALVVAGIVGGMFFMWRLSRQIRQTTDAAKVVAEAVTETTQGAD